MERRMFREQINKTGGVQNIMNGADNIGWMLLFTISQKTWKRAPSTKLKGNKCKTQKRRKTVYIMHN